GEMGAAAAIVLPRLFRSHCFPPPDLRRFGECNGHLTIRIAGLISREDRLGAGPVDRAMHGVDTGYACLA
ncbi:MAG: hypothetical protein ACREQV_14015, partial [Candidatus Binatia bacterium]